MAGLGEALPPAARSGLMLFLRRGMWGWAADAGCRRPRSTAGSSHIAHSTSAQRAHSCRSRARDYGDEHPRSENAMKESLKVQPHHLERGAYLYIRQSSMRQVIENVEST